MELNKRDINFQAEVHRLFGENQILLHQKNKLINELDQYKTAHDKLTAGLKEAVAESIKYKRERDSLIKDVEKLREELRMHIQCNDELGRVNKLKDETISELSYYRTYYVYLTNYIKEKAEHNPGNSRYIDLVDVIEVLEAE